MSLHILVVAVTIGASNPGPLTKAPHPAPISQNACASAAVIDLRRASIDCLTQSFHVSASASPLALGGSSKPPTIPVSRPHGRVVRVHTRHSHERSQVTVHRNRAPYSHGLEPEPHSRPTLAAASWPAADASHANASPSSEALPAEPTTPARASGDQAAAGSSVPVEQSVGTLRLPAGGEHPYVTPDKRSGRPVRLKGGQGFLDRRGNRWVRDRSKDREWDVEHPDGSHTNVNEDGQRTHGKDEFPGHRASHSDGGHSGWWWLGAAAAAAGAVLAAPVTDGGSLVLLPAGV